MGGRERRKAWREHGEGRREHGKKEGRGRGKHGKEGGEDGREGRKELTRSSLASPFENWSVAMLTYSTSLASSSSWLRWLDCKEREL